MMKTTFKAQTDAMNNPEMFAGGRSVTSESSDEPVAEETQKSCVPEWLTFWVAFTAVLLVVIGVVADVLLVLYFKNYDETQMKAIEDQRANFIKAQTADFALSLGHTLAFAKSGSSVLAGAFDSADSNDWPTLSQWKMLGQATMDTVPGISSILWSPMVRAEQKAEFQAKHDLVWYEILDKKYTAHFNETNHPWFPLRNLTDFDFNYPNMYRFPAPTGVKAVDMPTLDNLDYQDSRKDQGIRTVFDKVTTASYRLYLSRSNAFGTLLMTPTVKRASPGTYNASAYLSAGGMIRTVFIIHKLVEDTIIKKNLLTESNKGLTMWLHDTSDGVPDEEQYLYGFEWKNGTIVTRLVDDAACSCATGSSQCANCTDAQLFSLKYAETQSEGQLQYLQKSPIQFGERNWTVTLVPTEELVNRVAAPFESSSAMAVAVSLCTLLFLFLASMVLYLAYSKHFVELEKRKESIRVQQQAMNYMCHELRNPIHVIRYLAGEVADVVNTFADAYGLEMINLLQANTNTLYYIVNGFLDVAKGGQTVITLTESPVDVGKLCRNTLQMYSTLNANAEGLEFKLAVDPSLVDKKFYFDPVRLEQVLANGVTNAVKYCESGSITISLEVKETGVCKHVTTKHVKSGRPSKRTPEDFESGSSFSSGSGSDTSADSLNSAVVLDTGKTLVIRVTDTGIGIDEIDAESVFEDFAQSQNEQVLLQASTGLGLPIARKLARLMGGDVRLEPNKASKGTSFVFELPFLLFMPLPESTDNVKPKQAQVGNVSSEYDKPADTRVVPAPTGGRPTHDKQSSMCLENIGVIAAEDERATHIILKRMLEKGGASRVKMFFEGSELSRQFSTRAADFVGFDVVLLDMHMTYESGTTTLRNLRAAGCTLPCIAVTGSASEPEVKEYLEAGFADCLPKPYTRQQLFAIIRSVLSKKAKAAKKIQQQHTSIVVEEAVVVE